MLKVHGCVAWNNGGELKTLAWRAPAVISRAVRSREGSVQAAFATGTRLIPQWEEKRQRTPKQPSEGTEGTNDNIFICIICV